MRPLLVALGIVVCLAVLVAVLPRADLSPGYAQSLGEARDWTRPARWLVEQTCGHDRPEGEVGRTQLWRVTTFDRRPVRDEAGRQTGFELAVEDSLPRPDQVCLLRIRYVSEDGRHIVADEASEANGRFDAGDKRVTLVAFVPITARGWYLEWASDEMNEPIVLSQTGHTGVE